MFLLKETATTVIYTLSLHDALPSCPGTVVEVAVSENRRVRQGDLLFRIDDEPYLIALDRAEALMERVVHEVAALRASYRQKQEELKLAQTTAAYYDREFARHEDLAERKVIPVIRLDEVRHSLDVARNQVAARRQELSRILAALGGDPNLPAAKHPDYLEAKRSEERRVGKECRSRWSPYH